MIPKTVRLHAAVGPQARLAETISGLSEPAQQALVTIAAREDLPLTAGDWESDQAGCLVANVVRALDDGTATGAKTADMRVLELVPEMSSRDLNNLIVAWDEAAAQEGIGRGRRRRTRDGDAAHADAPLRAMLRGALAQAGVGSTLV